jgi:hypothetical protein
MFGFGKKKVDARFIRVCERTLDRYNQVIAANGELVRFWAPVDEFQPGDDIRCDAITSTSLVVRIGNVRHMPINDLIDQRDRLAAYIAKNKK